MDYDLVDNGDGTWTIVLNAKDRPKISPFPEDKPNVPLHLPGADDGTIAKYPTDIPPNPGGTAVQINPNLRFVRLGFSAKDTHELHGILDAEALAFVNKKKPVLMSVDWNGAMAPDLLSLGTKLNVLGTEAPVRCELRLSQTLRHALTFAPGATFKNG